MIHSDDTEIFCRSRKKAKKSKTRKKERKEGRKVGLTDSLVQNPLLWLICLSVVSSIYPSIHSSTPTTEQPPPVRREIWSHDGGLKTKQNFSCQNCLSSFALCFVLFWDPRHVITFPYVRGGGCSVVGVEEWMDGYMDDTTDRQISHNNGFWTRLSVSPTFP
jgi:hypothetical protein